MNKSKKLSIALAISSFGFTGSVNGMQSDLTSRFFLNEEKKIERFLDSGAALLEDSQAVIGKKMIEATPFKFMEESEKQKATDALEQAAQSSKKIKLQCKLWTTILETSILGMRDAQNRLSFLVKITKELPKDNIAPCSGGFFLSPIE